MEENKEINAIIGENLLKLRKNKKLTQLELAEQFNYSDKSISKWEKGESLPNIEVLCQLAEFYGVTLNDLTQENATLLLVELHNKKKNEVKKDHTPRMFSPKLMVTLLSVGAVWLLATVLFVTFKLTLSVDYYMCFMWAGVLTFVVLLVFNSVWGQMKYLFSILTILLWLALVSLHLQIYIHTNFSIWPVYFLGIPLQVLIILWGALIKRPKGYKKLQTDQTESDTRE